MKVTYEAEFITSDRTEWKVEGLTPIEAGALALERGAVGLRVCQVIRVEYSNHGAFYMIDSDDMITVDTLDRPIQGVTVSLDDIPHLIAALATIYADIKGEAR